MTEGPTSATSLSITAQSIDALDRAQQLLRTSFVRYVAQTARLAVGDDDAAATLKGIAEDQKDLADRIADQVRELGALPGAGAFPMAFTDSHDLTLSYLLARAVRCQQEDAAALRGLSLRPGLSRTSRMLLEESLGMALGHLELLETAILARVGNRAP